MPKGTAKKLPKEEAKAQPKTQELLQDENHK